MKTFLPREEWALAQGKKVLSDGVAAQTIEAQPVFGQIAIEAAVVAGSKHNRRSDMATIGSFKKVGNDFQGEIVTLSLQAKGVRIVAEANRSNDNAPSHRIYVGRAEIGAVCSMPSSRRRAPSRLNGTIPPSMRRSTRTCSTTKVVETIRRGWRP